MHGIYIQCHPAVVDVEVEVEVEVEAVVKVARKCTLLTSMAVINASVVYLHHIDSYYQQYLGFVMTLFAIKIENREQKIEIKSFEIVNTLSTLTCSASLQQRIQFVLRCIIT